MAVVERQRVKQEPERAVFVASDGRRARILRRAALGATFLACLWVVGLGVGMLGFGSLPGVSVVKKQIAEIANGSSGASRPDRTDVVRSSRRPTDVAPRPVAVAPGSDAVRSKSRTAARPAASRRASRRAAQATPPPPVAQQPVNPAQRTRGWARRGQPAPPGQTRRATPPPPPGTRGHVKTAPPPVPPRQTKKAQQPPPPPPPPKKG